VVITFRLTSLNEGGVTLPGCIKVNGLLIESEELEKLSHVMGDDRTFGFHIAEFINEFQVGKKQTREKGVSCDRPRV